MEKITYYLTHWDLKKDKLKVGKSLEEVMQFVDKTVAKNEKRKRKSGE